MTRIARINPQSTAFIHVIRAIRGQSGSSEPVPQTVTVQTTTNRRLRIWSGWVEMFSI